MMKNGTQTESGFWTLLPHLCKGILSGVEFGGPSRHRHDPTMQSQGMAHLETVELANFGGQLYNQSGDASTS